MKKTLLLTMLLMAVFSIKEAQAQCNASFTFSQDSGLVQITNTSTSGSVGYYSNWSFGDNTFSGDQNPSHQYTSPGTYNIVLFISALDSSCWDSVYVPVTISSVYTSATCHAYFSIDSAGNDPLHLQFNDQSSSSNTLTYAWTFGDGGTSTLSDPTHLYQQSGTYNICLTVTNPSTSCTDTYCQTIQVSPAPGCYASFYYNSPQPGTYSFFNLSTGSSLQYHWDFGDGNTSTIIEPTHTYGTSGSYMVVLTVTSLTDSSCYSQYNASINLNVNPPTCNSDFYIFQDSIDLYQYYLVNTSTGSNLNYYWDFGDGTIDSTMYPSHTYSDTLMHVVCLMVYNTSCQDMHCDSIYPVRSSGNITITVIPPPLSITESDNERVLLYPNPATETLNIAVPEANYQQMMIVDLAGRIILKEVISSSLTTLDVSSFAQGLYMVELISDDGKVKRLPFVK